MNVRNLILAFAAALTLSACGSPPSEPAASAPTAYAQGTVKKGDMAVCVICAGHGEGGKEEKVAEVIDYEGKTYAFCNEAEKAEFISNPAKYAAK